MTLVERYVRDDRKVEDDFALDPEETTAVGIASGTGELVVRRQAKLVMLGGDTPGRIYLLDELGEMVIGRDLRAQVRLTGPDISRRHAVVTSKGEHAFMIEDLGSRNGTLLNGVPLVGRAALHYGDRLQFGAATSCVFSYHDDADAQLAQLEKLEAVGQLASSLAHDFGNVLFVLGNCLVALEEAEDDPQERREIRADMTQAVDRGRTLTRQLLDVVRHDDSEREEMDLAVAVQDAADLFRRTLDDRPDLDLTLELETAPIDGNHNALQQAVLNLLINARDALPAGGHIRVRTGQGRALASTAASLLPQGPLAEVLVADDGIGMDTSTQQRIFEPFFTTKKRGKGTGLGLASVFNTVRDHGGQIHVDSALGKGTTFRLYLPLAEGERPHNKTLYAIKKV